MGQYVRVLVGSGEQKILDMLGDQSVWAFSLAFDSTTHYGQSFFDIRLLLCYFGSLLSLHIVVLPLYDRHTAQYVFSVVDKFLDAFYSPWRHKLVGLATDGENAMTGCHQGLVMRLEREASYSVLRVWCSAHQIDLVVKTATGHLANGVWAKCLRLRHIPARAEELDHY